MLQISGLSKSYGRIRALDEVDLSLEPGLYALLGPNGAGKSTLIGIITLSLRADAGRVEWDGELIERMGVRYRALLGYMPQQQALYDAFSGRDFLQYVAALKKIPRREAAGEVAWAAEKVNLSDRLEEKLGGYSGGMRQRILLASAILGKPQLLILDEPTAGLDPKERVRVRELVKELSADCIVLFATHVVSDIEKVADRAVFLKKGKVALNGPVEALVAAIEGAGGLEDVYMQVFGEDSDGRNSL